MESSSGSVCEGAARCGLPRHDLSSSVFPPLPLLLLPDGWEKAPLAALWQLLSAYLQCQTKCLSTPRLLSAATGWERGDAGGHAGPHWLREVPGRMPHVASTWFKVQKHTRQTPVSYVCTGVHAHPHTHMHVLSLLSHSSLLTATGTRCKRLASNQPTCYNEIHCALFIMLTEEQNYQHAWPFFIRLEYESVQWGFCILQILMIHWNSHFFS